MILVAALVFIIIRGRINFQYPRDPDDPKPSNQATEIELSNSLPFLEARGYQEKRRTICGDL